MAETQFASNRSPFNTFFSLFVLRYNFDLGKPFKGLLQWAIVIAIIFLLYSEYKKGNLTDARSNEYTYFDSFYKKDNPFSDFQDLNMNQMIIVGLFYFLLFWVIRDMFILFSGRLKDGEGKIITFRTGCSNCGFLGELNSSSKMIDAKKVKLKIEKVIAKNYDKFGRYIGSTKGVSEEDGWQRTIKTNMECPHCGYLTEETTTREGK